MLLTWTSLEEEEENSKEQVEDPHGCQSFVDCVLLCKVPERPTEDEVCLRKRLGKAPGIYRAHGIVQV